jgi:hypothetical protein
MKTNISLKWPLIIAAVVVVLRVILEQMGAPGGVTNLFSVVMLYLVIFPIYFALRIANSGVERPYRNLIKTTALYAALARAIVIPTYWLAYIYQWEAPRFSTAMGGVVGPNVSPLAGFFLIPFGALLLWVIGSIVIGGGIGSVVIALKRKSRTTATTPSVGR